MMINLLLSTTSSSNTWFYQLAPHYSHSVSINRLPPATPPLTRLSLSTLEDGSSRRGIEMEKEVREEEEEVSAYGIKSTNRDVIEKKTTTTQYNHYQPPLSVSPCPSQTFFKHCQYATNFESVSSQDIPEPDIAAINRDKRRRGRIFGGCLNLGLHLRNTNNNNNNRNKKNDNKATNKNRDSRNTNTNSFLDQLKTCLEAKIFLAKLYVRRKLRLVHSTNNSHTGVFSPIWTTSSMISPSPSAKLAAAGDQHGLISPQDTNGMVPIDNIEHDGQLANQLEHNHHDDSSPSGMDSHDSSSSGNQSAPNFACLFNTNQQEAFSYKQRARLIEKLNRRLVNMWNADGQAEMELARSIEEACAICFCAKADVQTFPCKHCAVCYNCFIRTILVSLQQKHFPLRCVICRSKVERVKATSYSRETDIN